MLVKKLSCLTYFYPSRFPSAKSEFQTRFKTRLRYSHTLPEISVIVNRERINNLLRIIYVGSNWNPNTITNPTAIADTGASHLYLTPNTPCSNVDPNALQVVVSTAGGPPHQSTATANIDLPLPVTTGYMIPNFHHNLMGIGPL